jgi:superfamily II DNA or RNA helicase
MKVTLKSNSGKHLDPETQKAVSLENGECVFPFIYKEKKYTKCVKKGLDQICATKVNKEGKLVKYANCEPKPSQSSPKKSPPPQKKVLKKKTLKKKVQLENGIPDALNNITYRIPETNIKSPEVYELPNRKNFLNWVDDTFKEYKFEKGYKFVKSDKVTFFNQQKLVRDYLQHDSPFRGLLLYHGLGVGKTCASIAIAEGFKSNRMVYILLNKSLKQNFIDNLMFCGNHMFRRNQHWIFKRTSGDTDFDKYASFIGIPAKVMKKNGGAWFVDFKQKANYTQLKKSEQDQLNLQIEGMIDIRYKFIHMDGLNKNSMQKLLDDRVLDNAVLIVDEVHNITNAMSKDTPGIRARGIRELIMDAFNLKLVFLSGTPMINDPYEVGQLFNLLRGYTKTLEISLKPLMKTPISYQELEKQLGEHALVNQSILNKRDHKLTLTQVPNGFINAEGNKGLVRSEMGLVGDDQFQDLMRTLLTEAGYSVTVKTNKYSAFPELRADFMKLFMDSSETEVRNEELFKNRILGMVSYYKTQDKDLLPTVTKNEIIDVPMSDYQFMEYSKVRKAEIEIDRNRNKNKKKKKKGNADEPPAAEESNIKSSYRAYSRIHCSFVFPAAIPRPYPGDIGEETELLNDIEDDLHDSHEDAIVDELVDSSVEEKKQAKLRIKRYEKNKELALRNLEKDKGQYLTMDVSDQLVKYSPKYDTLLNKLEESPGSAFVYTEYKTLEGIAVLGIVLKANGYTELKLLKDADGDYIVNDDLSNTNKRFAFWGGNIEESDIIRRIYNNQLDELPAKIRSQITNDEGNLYGDIIKVLMTTKTGAEGIDLHNVRQVHIIEPYWNPVRLKQVMGRAVRVNSHSKLPMDQRLVEIFTYITSITETQKKADKIIQIDSLGKSSDEVLFDISQRKLAVMNTIMKMIKEASIDCTLNAVETFDPEDPFTCMDYGPKSRLSRNDYSYVPNIMDEFTDREKSRRVKVDTWKPKFVKLPNGKEYALREGNPQLLYSASKTKEGRPGEPVGEIQILDSGQKKVKIY